MTRILFLSAILCLMIAPRADASIQTSSTANASLKLVDVSGAGIVGIEATILFEGTSEIHSPGGPEGNTAASYSGLVDGVPLVDGPISLGVGEVIEFNATTIAERLTVGNSFTSATLNATVLFSLPSSATGPVTLTLEFISEASVEVIGTDISEIAFNYGEGLAFADSTDIGSTASFDGDTIGSDGADFSSSFRRQSFALSPGGDLQFYLTVDSESFANMEVLQAPVPEPGSLATLGGLFSLFGLGYLRRRHRHAA